MSTGDHDADAIRNRRSAEALNDLLSLVPRIKAMFAALDGTDDDTSAKKNFELGNRVEDGLARLDQAVRAVGDLPDRLRATVAEAESAREHLHEAAKGYEESKSKLDALITSLSAGRDTASPGGAGRPMPNDNAARPAAGAPGSEPKFDPTAATPAENAETAADVASRTTREQPDAPALRPEQPQQG